MPALAMDARKAHECFEQLANEQGWSFFSRPDVKTIAKMVYNEVSPSRAHQSVINGLVRALDERTKS